MKYFFPVIHFYESVGAKDQNCGCSYISPYIVIDDINPH